MNALLLSAGYGSRISNFVKTKPKCLIKIHKKTILDYWLNILNNKLIDKIIINTHFQSNKIIDFIKCHQLEKKIIISHEKKILGSVGTLLNNKNLLMKYGNFFVAHSDNITSFNFKNFYDFHHKQKKIHTAMTFEAKSSQDCGIFKIKNDRLKYFQKKKNIYGNIANAAVFIFNKKIFKIISNEKKKIYDISSDMIPKIIDHLNLYHNTNYFRDIGTKKNLLHARKFFKDN